MRLHHHGRMLVLFEIIGPEADEFVELVHGAVEQHVVIGDVEVAVVVDPLRLDRHHRGDEGRGKLAAFWIHALIG